MARQVGQVAYGHQNWSTNIQGVTPAYLTVANWQIEEGRGLTEADEQSAALVALLGHTVAQQLFGAEESPVGATILAKGFPLRVVGVLAAKGQSAWGHDQDDIVMIPFMTAEQRVLGVATPSQTQTTNTQLYPPPVNPFGMQARLTGKVNAIFVQARAAVLLSAAGGAAGIVVGVGVSEVLSAVAGWPTLVSPAAIVGGFVFSAAVGVFFGYYPARKAAHLDPIEALRYE